MSRLILPIARPSRCLESHHCQWRYSSRFSRCSHAHRCLHSPYSLTTFSLQSRQSCTATSTWVMFRIPTPCRYSSSRDEISLLTHTLCVPAWPSAQTRAYLIPRVLAHMDNLRSLSHPSFDLHILRQHSAFGLRHIEFGNTRLSGQAEIELPTWLDGQTNVVSLRFPFLLDDDDVDASPPTPLPATPTRTRLLSAPTTPSQPFLFPMPPLSPVPPTPTPTKDTFTDTTNTLLPNLTTLRVPPRLIILLAPSRPLTDASITISTPIYARFRPTTNLESLPSSVRRLRFTFKSVGKRTEEKTLRSAIIICPTIDELEIEDEGDEECWRSIVPHFKSPRVLVMRIPGTAQVKTVKEELNERFPLPKRARTRSTSSTISHSGHSMVVSERARAARLANTCPALQHVVFPNGVQWRRPSPSFPRSRSTPSLPFDDLFVKKINRDVPPPPLPRKVFPLTEQRFVKAKQCFDLNDSDDDNDDSLFYKPSPSRQSSSMQRCHEQVEVEVRGAGKMVMALVLRKVLCRRHQTYRFAPDSCVYLYLYLSLPLFFDSWIYTQIHASWSQIIRPDPVSEPSLKSKAYREFHMEPRTQIRSTNQRIRTGGTRLPEQACVILLPHSSHIDVHRSCILLASG
ncbi:hypothetical protein ARMGADRAFT_1172281 [Armillaria gallica]|uniref:Uncharacterized protein n=1 Tax=Armillaria gallica TaxID=47427 RepID=A0A2H3CSH2_ARMGA|nr:hypothetical protein ARMGADRAFT_1172281 [Armillaria gallica]